MNPKLKQYAIDREIGRGGFAITWLAHRGQKKVVLKELLLDKISDWQALESFEREAKVLSHLNHKGIPRFIDFVEKEAENGKRLFLVQEFIEGENIENSIQQGRYFTENEVITIATQLAETLIYLQAFSPPIVHRDIKPGNILLTANQAYLVDFGAVKAPAAKHTGLTVTGTVGYMPLEQVEGRTVASSDIYALGMTLVYMLSHKHPQNMDKKNLKVDFKPHVNISKAFAKVIDKMIAPDVGKRYADAQSLLPDLKALTHTYQDKDKDKGTGIDKYWKPLLGIGLAFTCLGLCSLNEVKSERAAIKKERALVKIEQERLKNMPSAMPSITNVLGNEKTNQALGNRYYKAHDYKKVITYYTPYLEQQPNAHHERFRRGYAYGKLKQHKKAIADFEYILKHDSTPDVVAYYNLGYHYYILKDYKMAGYYFNKMNQLRPKHLSSINYLGMLALKKNDTQNALKWFNHGLSIDPSDKYFYNNIGQTYQKAKKYPEAIKAFKKSLELNQKKVKSVTRQYARPYMHISQIYLVQAKYPAAISAASEAIRRTSNYTEAYAVRAQAYKSIKNCAAALPDAKKACDLGFEGSCNMTCP